MAEKLGLSEAVSMAMVGVVGGSIFAALGVVAGAVVTVVTLLSTPTPPGDRCSARSSSSRWPSSRSSAAT